MTRACVMRIYLEGILLACIEKVCEGAGMYYKGVLLACIEKVC